MSARIRDANQPGPRFTIEGAEDFQLTDSISFEGVESINPFTGTPTGHELRVMFRSYGESDRPRDQDLAYVVLDRGILIVTPQLITEGMYRNASKLPAAGARITNHSIRRRE